MERVCLKCRVIFLFAFLILLVASTISTSLASNGVVDSSSNVHEIAREMALEKRLADVRETIS